MTLSGKTCCRCGRKLTRSFPDAIDDDDEGSFGLDSAAFMTLLAEIEEVVGYIPSAILEGDLYPETFGELVAAYDQ